MSVLDIAPTLLAWAGLPIGKDMDGQVAAFLAGVTPDRIDTYDTAPIERLETGESGADRGLIDQLRALG